MVLRGIPGMDYYVRYEDSHDQVKNFYGGREEYERHWNENGNGNEFDEDPNHEHGYISDVNDEMEDVLPGIIAEIVAQEMRTREENQ